MFLKTATMIAIAGVALSFLLSLMQQVMFAARLYGDFYLTLSRLMSMLELLLLHGGLLLFLVAFLLSLKAKTT
ncbi:MAG: hypothetical protein ABI596_12565 [Pyrinomonadaceae bacterium]